LRLGKPNNNGTPIKDDLCELAAAYIRPTGCVSIIVMHSKQPHTLVLWPDDLEELAIKCRELRAKLTPEKAA
jgi:hypothetical protein